MDFSSVRYTAFTMCGLNSLFWPAFSRQPSKTKEMPMWRKTLGLLSVSALLFSSLIAFVPAGTSKPGMGLVVSRVGAPLAASPWGNPTATTIYSSSNPSVFGQTVTLTATVTGQPMGEKPITGKIAFKVDGKTIGGILYLADGTASLDVSTLEAGEHEIFAKYSGDANYAPSESQVLEQSVIQSTVSLSASPQQPLYTTNGDFVAYVTITNTGNTKVNSVHVTSATLGSGSLVSAPAPITNLAAGQNAVVTLTFSSNAVSSTATTAPLRLNVTYSVKGTEPSGNLALDFPNVRLH
jgi:hypothetical protein